MRGLSTVAGRVLSGLVLIGAAASAQPTMAAPVSLTTFTMVSSGACLPNAKATVTINSLGPVEVMTVNATGLPKNTEFDLFNIQVPEFPFGLSWYLGDMETDNSGRASGTFIGRFSKETFIVAPGVAPAPRVDPADATNNPATAPVHVFHLGLWFNSPADAVEAGCPGIVTPFNGEHNAGVQVLNTSNAPDNRGPLSRIIP